MHATLRPPRPQNSPQVLQTRPESAPAATRPCNTTSSTTSYRPSRARNPSEPLPLRPPAAVCDGDVQESDKRRRRNSSRHSPKAQPPPMVHKAAPPPAGIPTLRPTERASVFSYARGPYHPIIPELDASASPTVAKSSSGRRPQPPA